MVRHPCGNTPADLTDWLVSQRRTCSGTVAARSVELVNEWLGQEPVTLAAMHAIRDFDLARTRSGAYSACHRYVMEAYRERYCGSLAGVLAWWVVRGIVSWCVGRLLDLYFERPSFVPDETQRRALVCARRAYGSQGGFACGTT